MQPSLVLALCNPSLLSYTLPSDRTCDCRYRPNESSTISKLLTALATLFFLSGCASFQEGSNYYDQDELGRYYKTENSTQLRVDPEGTVRMIWDGEDPLQPPRIIGRASKVGEVDKWDWDLTQYKLVEPTGACSDWVSEEPGVSCWNLILQVPFSIVAAPFYLLYTALELRLGIYQGRELRRVGKDIQTCSMQECNQEERESVEQRLRFAQALLGLVYVPGTHSGSSYYPGQLQTQGMPQAPLLGPVTPNAYGPGLHSDATGRPFMWTPQFGGAGSPDPNLRVQPNVYGPGIGMDQYGRPAKPACPPGTHC